MVDDLWDFNTFATTGELLNAITNIPYRGVGTLTGQALTYVFENKLSRKVGRRPNVPLMVMVLTDGKCIILHRKFGFVC